VSGAWVVCDDCDGTRKRGGVKCAGCDGFGQVLSTAGRDALAELIGDDNVQLLDDNRDVLAGWLTEAEILRPTGYGLVRYDQGHDGWGHRLAPEMLVRHIEPGPNPRRLYRLVVR